jgi:hypothetical protein
MLERTETTVSRASERSWVYFIESGEGGPIKIGYGKNVDYRISNLQMGNPVQLRLLGKALADDALAVEELLHDRFREYRIRGEWYRPVPELVELARTCADLTMQRLCEAFGRDRLPPGDVIEDVRRTLEECRSKAVR